MPTHDEYFFDLKDWSKRNLGIVQKYWDDFARILGHAFKGRFIR